MAWLESHQTLANHPKTLKLSRLLNVPRVTVIGHLHFLWWWALDYAQDGDLSKFDDLDIAVAADWQGEPEVFLSSLKRAGFLNEDGTIHDWHEYAGRLIERRRADAERKRGARKAASAEPPSEEMRRPSDVHRMSSGSPEDGVRNPTVPYTNQHNRTRPDQTETPPLPPEGNDVVFDELWALAINRNSGVKVARAAFDKAVKRAPPEVILAGFKRHVPVWETFEDKTKIPHVSTWLNQDRWTVENPIPPSNGRAPTPIRNKTSDPSTYFDLGERYERQGL